jgi:hypothetical protein
MSVAYKILPMNKTLRGRRTALTLAEAANLGEIVGAASLVVSLVYVGIQVKQSNAIGRANAYRAFHQDIGSVLNPISTDPEMYRIWQKAMLSEEPLEPGERDRLGMLLFQMFGALNAGYQSYWVDPSIKNYVRSMISFQLNHKHIREWWSRQRDNHPEPFRAYVDERLEEIEVKICESNPNTA